MPHMLFDTASTLGIANAQSKPRNEHVNLTTEVAATLHALIHPMRTLRFAPRKTYSNHTPAQTPYVHHGQRPVDPFPCPILASSYRSSH